MTILNENEAYKYKIIKNLVKNKGNKLTASLKLHCTIRTVNNLIQKYLIFGKAGFSHGNKGKLPIKTKDNDLKEKILTLYKERYSMANWTHFHELLEEFEDIKVSYTFLHQLLKVNGFISPKSRKQTKKDKKEQLEKKVKNKEKLTDFDKILLTNFEETENNFNLHPRKSRSKYFGELVQMDASLHKWFGSGKTQLHLAIDDATGNIIGARFEKQETIQGYYQVFKQILTNYGIPYEFFTDNRATFKQKKNINVDLSKDVFTQFNYACSQLGTHIKTSSEAQAKGRVERNFGTLQSRLTTELDLANISSLDDANNFLINIFIPRFNKRFGLDINKFQSVFEESPSEETINNTLAIIVKRKFDSGSSIKFNREYYQAYKYDSLINFSKSTECLVIKTFDNRLVASVNDHMYLLKKLEKNKKFSRTFDDIPKVKKSTAHIPPMSHPWKKASFEAFLNKQRHLKNHQVIT